MRVLFYLVIASVTACTIKPGRTGKANKVYETFYLGDKGTQYFIKPLAFSSTGNEELSMDITFRSTGQLTDTAAINVSIFSAEQIKDIKTITFTAADVEERIMQSKLLFVQPKKDLFESRFTIPMPSTVLENYVASTDHKIDILTPSTNLTFTPDKRTLKQFNALTVLLFSLF